jgi:hypothetical protein
MDAEVIALTDRGAQFTFQGDPFRSRQEIPNQDILEINFSQVAISDADVEAIQPLTHLEGISFWKTDITDRAIELIASLPRLMRLNLCGTRVTDASVPTLIGMPLTYIDVADTLITPRGVETLREGLPDAELLA